MDKFLQIFFHFLLQIFHKNFIRRISPEISNAIDNINKYIFGLTCVKKTVALSIDKSIKIIPKNKSLFFIIDPRYLQKYTFCVIKINSLYLS